MVPLRQTLQIVILYTRDVLGAEVSAAENLPEHGVTTVFVNLGNTKIELLHPFGEKSPIQVTRISILAAEVWL